MKGLSIRQPWAWAIAHAGKRVENRSQHTHYRGPILIHASLKPFDGGVELLEAILKRRVDRDEVMRERGNIIAIADLVDSVHIFDLEESGRATRWAFGEWCWLLDNVRTLTPTIKATGALGLWTPSSYVRGALGRYRAKHPLPRRERGLLRA